MSKVLITDTTMTAIADAIREKLGTSETMLPSEMPEAILSIQGGGGGDVVFPVGTDVRFGWTKSVASTFTDASFLEQVDFRNVTDLSALFNDCENLEIVPNLKNTYSATSMSAMFQTCHNLINAPQMSYASVTTIHSMFNECSSLVSVPDIELPVCTTADVVFQNCTSLETAPNITGDSVTTVASMFNGCTNLKNVPVYSFPNVKNRGHTGMFQNCGSLTNESLNNILATCLTFGEITARYKTLAVLGLSSSQVDICQTLSNYSAVIAAGWGTGY